MRELVGVDLWDLHAHGWWVAITTNGSVRRDGCAVMGRGCAYEAAQRFPGLAADLGLGIKRWGNVPIIFTKRHLVTLPVKHCWRDAADVPLIKGSLYYVAVAMSPPSCIWRIALPRPGCGNGRLRWEDVKPEIEPLLDDRFVVVTKDAPA